MRALAAPAVAMLLLLATLPSTPAALQDSTLTAWLGMLEQHIRSLPYGCSHMQAAKWYAGMSLSAYNTLQTARRYPKPVDETAAVAFACHTYLNHYFPTLYWQHDILIQSQIEPLDATVKQTARIVAQAETTTIIAGRIGDGFDTWADYQPQPPAPGVWRLLPGNTYAEFPQWGYTKPYILSERDVQSITSTSVRAVQGYFGSDKYYQEVEYVRNNGGSNCTRSAYDAESPFFWADGPGTATTPGHYLNISQQVMPQDMPLYEQARFFAALTATISDACIPCFRVKYTVNLWRPYSAITLGDGSGRQSVVDPTWQPTLKVPPHPSYPSGHSCVSGAAVEVLKAYFQTDSCQITVASEGKPDAVPRSFTTFSSICQETGKSRVLGGLHYPNDCDAGIALAKDVAAVTLKKMGIIGGGGGRKGGKGHRHHHHDAGY